MDGDAEGDANVEGKLNVQTTEVSTTTTPTLLRLPRIEWCIRFFASKYLNTLVPLVHMHRSRPKTKTELTNSSAHTTD